MWHPDRTLSTYTLSLISRATAVSNLERCRLRTAPSINGELEEPKGTTVNL